MEDYVSFNQRGFLAIQTPTRDASSFLGLFTRTWQSLVALYGRCTFQERQ
jgi:hypothetical protein